MKFALVFAAALTAVSGYPSAPSAAPDPANEKATVPPIRYQSPFRGYRPLGDDQRTPWKAANDEVGRIGGWRAYAKESREAPTMDPTPTAAPSTPAKPIAEPPAQGDAGHTGHSPPKKE